MHLLTLASQLFLALQFSQSLGLSISATSQVKNVTKRASIWQPAPGVTFQMILYGILNLNATSTSVIPDVEVYDLDLFETPKDTITALHRLGKKVICYFSAGTSESWRPDFANFTAADLGTNLTYWPGERWLDIRSSRVVDIMKARIQLGAAKGCDAVDPDDVDVYSNDNGGGFAQPVTEAQSITFFKTLQEESHKYNMAIGLKNSLEILTRLTPYADFAVNEECAWEGDCNSYADLTTNKKKAVFHVEYATHYDIPIYLPNVTSTATTTTSAAPIGTYTFIWSYLWPNASDVTLLSTLCLLDNTTSSKTTASKLQLSTVIKEMIVDGWMMDCTGQTFLTYVTPPNRTTPAGGAWGQAITDVGRRSAETIKLPLGLPDIDIARSEAEAALQKRDVEYLPERMAMKERKRAWRAAKRAAKVS